MNTITGINPLARVLRASHSEVDPAELLSRRDFENDTLAQELAQAPAISHTPGLSSFVASARTLDPYRWQLFLREYVLSRPAEVLRVKGYLAFAGQPGRILFQAVRDVFSAQRLDDDLTPGSELVFIGRGLDRAEYVAALQECQVDAPTP